MRACLFSLLALHMLCQSIGAARATFGAKAEAARHVVLAHGAHPVGRVVGGRSGLGIQVTGAFPRAAVGAVFEALSECLATAAALIGRRRRWRLCRIAALDAKEEALAAELAAALAFVVVRGARGWRFVDRQLTSRGASARWAEAEAPRHGAVSIGVLALLGAMPAHPVLIRLKIGAFRLRNAGWRRSRRCRRGGGGFSWRRFWLWLWLRRLGGQLHFLKLSDGVRLGRGRGGG